MTTRTRSKATRERAIFHQEAAYHRYAERLHKHYQTLASQSERKLATKNKSRKPTHRERETRDTQNRYTYICARLPVQPTLFFCFNFFFQNFESGTNVLSSQRLTFVIYTTPIQFAKLPGRARSGAMKTAVGTTQSCEGSPPDSALVQANSKVEITEHRLSDWWARVSREEQILSYFPRRSLGRADRGPACGQALSSHES